MTRPARPVSIVAERAVRYLRDRDDAVASVDLAREVLRADVSSEATARSVLETAFAGDTRLAYTDGAWHRVGATTPTPAPQARDREDEPDRVLLLLDGFRDVERKRFVLTFAVAIRLRRDDVVTACCVDHGAAAELGIPGEGLPDDPEQKFVFREALDGAVPVVHDAPGSIEAFERWLDVPVPTSVSLRRLGRTRLGLPARHRLEDLVAKLGLPWRETEDRLDLAEVLDDCLDRLREPQERLFDLQRASHPDGTVIDWSRFAFSAEFIRSIPRVAGTYRFFDRDDELLYVGKSKDLRRRVASYFRHGVKRSKTQRSMLERLYRIEIEPTGSDLEAILREARRIRAEHPDANVQRRVHVRRASEDRLRSILVLEPATPPHVLRAYLIRDGRWIASVPIGPRGGGLKRIERVLEDRYFSIPDGPTPSVGPDIDVELVARWLAANRDRVVAFDPTDLKTPEDVTDRLRWFLSRGGPFDGDGAPIRRV